MSSSLYRQQALIPALLLLLESVESCVRLEEAQERQWATMGSKKTEESQQVGEVE